MANTRSQLELQAELVQLYRRAIISGLPIDTLETTIHEYENRIRGSAVVEDSVDKQRVKTLKNSLPLPVRVGAFLLPVVFIIFGLYLLGSAVVPILAYYVTTAPELQANKLTAPIPTDQVLEVNPLILAQTAQPEEVVEQVAQWTGPQFINTELDYTNLLNWFDGSSMQELIASSDERATEYTLDIPSLNIANAKVAVGGTDLNKSTIAYPGTALPGEAGAPVIFGHSVLRQFYNPSEKNPRRYNSIFSTIMTMKPGEKIYVTYEGVKYTYLVQDKTEVKPTDVYILEQNYSNKLLKLVTCTPEGTYLRRGVITAVLVEGEG